MFDQAVQAVCAPRPENTAVQASQALHHLSRDAPAGQVGHLHQPPHIFLHDAGMDALCPDRDYQRLVRKETKKEARNKERQEDLERFRKTIEKTSSLYLSNRCLY